MKKIIFSLALLHLVTFSYAQSIQSINKEFTLQTELNSGGSLLYSLSYKNQNLVTKGKTGFVLSNNEDFYSNFSVVKWDTLTHRSTWQPVWGEVKEIKNEYKELAITLQQKSTNRILLIRFRLFNDGLGFRYEFPQQNNLQHFVVKDELTSFPLAGNHKAFWIPGDYDTNEYIYSTTLLSEIDENNRSKQADEISTRVAIPNAVQTPLQLKSKEGLYINIHEA
ncbi:MAG: glycoside hydrolase family 97 N-terminal domain-containing protein, partial [Chryseotalea sp.]